MHTYITLKGIIFLSQSRKCEESPWQNKINIQILLICWFFSTVNFFCSTTHIFFWRSCHFCVWIETGRCNVSSLDLARSFYLKKRKIYTSHNLPHKKKLSWEHFPVHSPIHHRNNIKWLILISSTKIRVLSCKKSTFGITWVLHNPKLIKTRSRLSSIFKKQEKNSPQVLVYVIIALISPEGSHYLISSIKLITSIIFSPL